MKGRQCIEAASTRQVADAAMVASQTKIAVGEELVKLGTKVDRTRHANEEERTAHEEYLQPPPKNFSLRFHFDRCLTLELSGRCRNEV